ncbi:MAG: RNA polymerase sigma factor, partial [Gemmataceae bacterium]
MTDWTDAELVAACRREDPVALRSFVTRFQQDIHRLAWRLLRHHQDAEDVTQEVFVRAIRALHRWDGVRPLRPWVVAIAVNRCRTWLSQRPRRPELVDYLDSTAAERP